MVDLWCDEMRKRAAYCSAVHPNEDSSNLVLHEKHKNWSFYARSSPVVHGKMVLHICMTEAEPLKHSPVVYFGISLSNDITDKQQAILWPAVASKFITGEIVCGSSYILILLLILPYSCVLLPQKISGMGICRVDRGVLYLEGTDCWLNNPPFRKAFREMGA